MFSKPKDEGLPPPNAPATPAEFEEKVHDEDESADTTPYRYSITSYGADYPVDGLVKRLKSGDIIVPTFHPEVPLGEELQGFQRKFVWTKAQCDRFVESLLLGLPVPGIFLAKQSDGRLIVLDGQQRLRTLQTFYDGILRGKEFSLSNVQKQYQAKTYATLAVEDRRRLDDAIIHATVVRQDEPSNDLSSIYLVFERLNTGGTTLQPQEIRVALYHGAFINFLREVNDSKSWRALYGPHSPRYKVLVCPRARVRVFRHKGWIVPGNRGALEPLKTRNCGGDAKQQRR